MNQNFKTIVYYNKANLLHRSSKIHPQSPQRLQTLIQSLSNYKKINKYFDINEVMIGEGNITKQKIEQMVRQLHGESYWEFIKEMWYQGIQKPEMYINTDTYFMKDTYFSAIQAARTTVIAAQALSKNQNCNIFSMVRPPGHHSGLKTQPHGFSFFNNIALAANFLTSTKRAKRVAIVDWDVHHGEGTQKLFYKRKDVLFISLHRYDNGKFFPHIKESSNINTGQEEGVGHNINICWNLQQKPKGYTYSRQETCGDQEYLHAFKKIVIPVVKQFKPDYILISCGFDSAEGDPIGNLKVTQAGYTVMLKMLMNLKINLLLVLEGGYNKQVLRWAGQAIIRTLTNNQKESVKEKLKELQNNQPNIIGQNAVKETYNIVKKYWTSI